MTDKLPDKWTSRDFPVLVEVVRRVDAGEDFILASDVAVTLGMDEGDVEAAGRALRRRGLVVDSGSMAAEFDTFADVSGEAYLLTGLHPSGDDAVSRLVDALRQAAEQVEDPVEKGRLRALADHAGSVSPDVLGGVLTLDAPMNAL